MIAGPNTVAVGNAIMLNGSGSFDPEDQYALTFLWDLDNDGVYGEGNTQQGYETSGEFTFFDAHFVSPGPWTVGLKVIDPAGNDDTTTFDITILPNGAPAADAGGPYTVQEGRDVILDATGTADPEGDPLQYL